MAKKAKRVKRTLGDEDRRKYADIRRQLEGERDEILTEARLRKRLHDTLTAELRQAFRVLKQERIAQGLSLADMQDRTGMSRSAISRLETLSRYAEALGKELAIALADKAR